LLLPERLDADDPLLELRCRELALAEPLCELGLERRELA
jgi:hypothetical protein